MSNPAPLWRIYCITESQFTYGFSSSALTTCPNNVAHTVQAGSSVMVKRCNSGNLFSIGNLLTYTTTETSRTLTADMYYDNLIVPGGVTLISGGYRIFVAGTLTLSGTIHNNGTSAVDRLGGAAAPSGTIGGGAVGGNGSNVSFSPGLTGGSVAAGTRLGGNGGNGGAATSGSGAGGTATQPAATAGGTTVIYNTIGNLIAKTLGNVVINGGCGGGGGGGDGTGAIGTGGGGGGGAGVVIVTARRILPSGSITAIGGRGMNGTSGGALPAAGGGGGGGGVVIVITNATLNSLTYFTATGGAPGISINGATNGTNGGDGVALVIYV